MKHQSNTPHEILEQLKANGQHPGEEIFRLRNSVAGAEARMAKLEGQEEDLQVSRSKAVAEEDEWRIRAEKAEARVEELEEESRCLMDRVARLEAYDPLSGEFVLHIGNKRHVVVLRTAVRDALLSQLEIGEAEGHGSIVIGNSTITVGKDGDIEELSVLRTRVAELEAGQLPPAAKQACRFWSDDPEGAGFEWHRTWEEARKYAQESIDEWGRQSSVFEHEWPQEVESVRWGVVIEVATFVDGEHGGYKCKLRPMEASERQVSDGQVQREATRARPGVSFWHWYIPSVN